MIFGSSKPQQPLKFTAAMDSINLILQKDNELLTQIITAKDAEIIRIKEDQPDAKTYLVIKINDNNYLIHDDSFKMDQQIYRPFHVTLKENALECIKHNKSPFEFVPPSESKLGILKSVKQPDALAFIEHEIAMLNLTGNSEAKVPIVIGEECYIAMKDAGTVNLDTALETIEFPEVVSCILKAMQNLIKMHEKGIFHNDITLTNIMFPSGEWVDFEYATSSADEKHKNISQLSSLENNPEKDVKDFSTILGIIIDKYEDSPQYKDQINLLSTVQASLETVKEKDEKKKVTKEDSVAITLPLLKSAEKSLNQIRIELETSKYEEKLQHLSRDNKIG